VGFNFTQNKIEPTTSHAMAKILYNSIRIIIKIENFNPVLREIQKAIEASSKSPIIAILVYASTYSHVFKSKSIP
jgi:hypothetical protein